jgi:periplasmic divalent cation tolerance protein
LSGDYIVVLATFSSREEAERVANVLLQKRLIACANVLGPVSSLFWWSGNLDNAEEFLAIMKSRKVLFGEIAREVKALHSYAIPEIIALPIVAGYEPYLSWVGECVTLG